MLISRFKKYLVYSKSLYEKNITYHILLSIILYAAPHLSTVLREWRTPDFMNEKLAVKSKELCFEAVGGMHSGISKNLYGVPSI